MTTTIHVAPRRLYLVLHTLDGQTIRVPIRGGQPDWPQQLRHLAHEIGLSKSGSRPGYHWETVEIGVDEHGRPNI